MKNKADEKIDALRKFFTITVAAFEMQHTISLAFGYKGHKSYMHLLHINAKEEIEKENPDLNVMDKYLAMMEAACENNPQPDNFEKGGV